jgi:2,3-bisphosphoglycerate-dependent phosphoglycerate mutase
MLTYLVLVRHGQSVWNLENRFTGNTDVDLTAQGREEARLTGEKLKKRELPFEAAFTSMLKRAQETLHYFEYHTSAQHQTIYICCFK